MKANYVNSQHDIDGYMLQSYTAWKGGKYYEAGNLGGLIDTYLYYMPDPKPTYPGNAGRDYYSGVFYGWVSEDVKANMDACFPDDTLLG